MYGLRVAAWPRLLTTGSGAMMSRGPVRDVARRATMERATSQAGEAADLATLRPERSRLQGEVRELRAAMAVGAPPKVPSAGPRGETGGQPPMHQVSPAARTVKRRGLMA